MAARPRHDRRMLFATTPRALIVTIGGRALFALIDRARPRRHRRFMRPDRRVH